MGSCGRESCNIWLRLWRCIYLPYASEYWTHAKEWKEFKHFVKRLFTDKWTRQYFWHDSFGCYFYRWFICPFKGHRDVRAIEDYVSGEVEYHYCFACEKKVKGF